MTFKKKTMMSIWNLKVYEIWPHEKLQMPKKTENQIEGNSSYPPKCVKI